MYSDKVKNAKIKLVTFNENMKFELYEKYIISKIIIVNGEILYVYKIPNIKGINNNLLKLYKNM